MKGLPLYVTVGGINVPVQFVQFFPANCTNDHLWLVANVPQIASYLWICKKCHAISLASSDQNSPITKSCSEVMMERALK